VLVIIVLVYWFMSELSCLCRVSVKDGMFCLFGLCLLFLLLLMNIEL